MSLVTPRIDIEQWYDELNEAERTAVNHYLLSGSPYLVAALCEQSQRLQRFCYQSFIDCPEKPILKL